MLVFDCQYYEEWTRQNTPHQVMNKLQALGVAAAAVQNGEDLYYDPQLRNRSYMVGQNIPRMGNAIFAGAPFKLSQGQKPHVQRAPGLGENNDYGFCQLLGLSPQEVEKLTEAKVIS